MEKTNKIKYMHFAIIILGIIFISIPIFHNQLWFDESYSVGMASKSFIDIWTIGSNDVHPVLYYWILHIIYLIFGHNIYIYRFFSMVPIAILAILGYTHIKRDFGEKVGALFSFFVLFLPISTTYSGEIRMYTWAMLFVSLMSIYAYRVYQKSSNKNWILFAIFSLASAYTHYYGLATAGIVNFILFIYFLYEAIKKHKNNKENKIYTAELKRFTISAITQILLYLPWLVFFLRQFQGVSRGFWIERPSVKIWLQILTFQFTGNLDVIFISQIIAIVFAIILLAYNFYAMFRLIIQHRKLNKRKLISAKKAEKKVENLERETERVQQIELESNKPGLLAFGIYILVMISIFIISLKVPILYARYFLNITGIFMFFLAYFMAKGGRKTLTILICFITIIVAGYVNYNVAKMNYDPTNKQPIAYVKQDLKSDDMILFANEGSGFVLSMQLNDIQNCFYDKENWNVEPAYKAFGKDMLTIKNLEPLDNYEGRIWIINSDSYTIYNEFVDRYKEKIKLIKQEKFTTGYHSYKYSISLIEKQAK